MEEGPQAGHHARPAQQTEVHDQRSGRGIRILDSDATQELRRPRDATQSIFEILGFNHLYRIFPSEVEAILSFREEGKGGGPGE